MGISGESEGGWGLRGDKMGDGVLAGAGGDGGDGGDSGDGSGDGDGLEGCLLRW